MVLIVGTYSKITDQGIHLFELDAKGNEMTPIGGITDIENPSYLDINDNEGLIYAVTEKKKDAASELHIYQLRKDNKDAELVTCIPYTGAASCYISTDSTRTHAFISNYGDGTLTVIKLPNGTHQTGVVQQLRFEGSGPDEHRQDQPHLHAALLSPDERFLYCSDLGSDRLYRFAYHPGASIPLHAIKPNFAALPPGSGPRHLVFGPDGRRLYLITELSGDIFMFDTNELTKGFLQQVSLLQDGYTGKIEAADIQIHPGGHYLYASNRGDANEIIVFSIDPTTGELEFLQRIGAAGLSPRNLLIREREGIVLAANEQSNNVSIFNLKNDGTLEFTKQHLQIPSPTCLKAID